MRWWGGTELARGFGSSGFCLGLGLCGPTSLAFGSRLAGCNMTGEARRREGLGSDFSAALVRSFDGEGPFEADRGCGEGRLRAIRAWNDGGRLGAPKLLEDEAAVIQRAACRGRGVSGRRAFMWEDGLMN